MGRWRPPQNLGRGHPLLMDGVVGREDRRDEAGDGRGVEQRRMRGRYAGRLAGELRASGECICLLLLLLLPVLLLCCCLPCLVLFLHAALCRKIFCATCIPSFRRWPNQAQASQAQKTTVQGQHAGGWVFVADPTCYSAVGQTCASTASQAQKNCASTACWWMGVRC